MHFEECFHNSKYLLTEGALVERLKHEYGLIMDSHVNHAGLIYNSPDILAVLYKQYIEIAHKFDLPIMLMTPTRKVNFESIGRSKYSGHNLIADSCSYLNKIRSNYPDFAHKIFIGGLLGCRNDAYRSDNSLNLADSYEFHKKQVDEFKKTGVDFLFAGIMPAMNEALGMAKAMAESGIPYIISFMIRKDGCLIDGTSISEAIKIIDQETYPQPLCYMSNCVHPQNLKRALENEVNINSPCLNRFLGIQANASSLSPEELNNCGIIRQENFDDMVSDMIDLVDRYRFKVLGGCCGTNNVFIEKLAEKLIT